MPRQILLSYAREDAAVVAEMVADLRALDHEVWLDQDLGGGQDWWDEILARIRWCDAFVPVLSRALLGSRACAGERTYAVALSRPVLPVAVADIGPEGLLDDDLARRQRITYEPGDKRSTLRLLGAVHRLPPAPPLPATAPNPPPPPMAYLGALRTELDGTAALDFDRQLVLLGRLTAEAEDVHRHPEVAALVQIFRDRREVAAYVERQLAALQQRLGAVESLSSVQRPRTTAPDQRLPRAEVLESGGAVLRLALFLGPGERKILKVDRLRNLSSAVQLDGRALLFSRRAGEPYWVDTEQRVSVSRVALGVRPQVRVREVVVYG